jgi:hypothetical protein
MASSACLPAAVAPNVDAGAPDDCGGELHVALASAEALLLAACARATPSAVAALGDTGALLRRVDAVSAAASSLRCALTEKQPAADGAGGVLPHGESGEDFFSSLPHLLVVRVLAALPADARLRCAEVCKAWRAAVSDRSLWRRVDLSPEGGVTHPVTDALLQAVSARAGGHMQALVLSLTENTCEDVFVAVLQANSSKLHELDLAPFEVVQPLFVSFVERVLDAAPQLQVLRCNVTAPVRQAVRLLRNETPFGPLRVCFLNVAKDEGDEGAEEAEEERVDDADLLALAADMRQHASLEGVELEDVPLDTPAVLDAFVNAWLVRGLSMLGLVRCCLSPASAPALARLLGGGALKTLNIVDGGAQLLDAPAAALLAGALRANTTLRFLQLSGVDLWRVVHAGACVIGALTAHPSLQCLSFENNLPATAADAAAAGASLGALVAANAPALQQLVLQFSSLGDDGLAPVLDALRANTHLRSLSCWDNDMSNEFARDAFLPAIRANGSLRQLGASKWWGGQENGVAPQEVLQAEALVKARAKAEVVPI